MRAVIPAVLIVALLAGCSAPVDEAPANSEGPIDLSGALGLLLLDVESETVSLVAQNAALAWMSANASVITWTESTFSVMLDLRTGAREVVPLTRWVRVYDNATGLELVAGEARVRELLGGATRANWTIPPGPSPETPWSAASDDLALLGGEYAVPGRAPCGNDIFLRGQRAERTTGCHLRIAPDGRAGWTEAEGVRVRERDGTIVNLTGPGSGDAPNGTLTTHENPIFSDDGIFMLRLTGGAQLVLSEIVSDDGEVLATLDGPRRIALHDVSADGRYMIVRTFER